MIPPGIAALAAALVASGITLGAPSWPRALVSAVLGLVAFGLSALDRAEHKLLSRVEKVEAGIQKADDVDKKLQELDEKVVRLGNRIPTAR